MAKKITEDLINQINILYSKYHNLSQVGRELSIAPTTVKKYLNEENLNFNKKNYDDRDALFFYIYHLFGPESPEQPVSNWNLTQMNKFVKMGISYKAQLLTLKWYYEIQKNPVKEQYHTIGIIPYIFDNAFAYYKREINKQKEMEAAIAKQLEKDRIEINFNPKDYMGRRKKAKSIDLNSIIGDTIDKD